MTMTSVRAPAPPGELGEALEPAEVLTYLRDLEEWVGARKSELDDLDAEAMAAHRRDELTRDMLLSMALWKAVSDRHQLLMATWDSGRVGETDRKRLSSLIWGRLDATLDPQVDRLAVSLPEACRLSDALVSQLRTRLALDPTDDASVVRIKNLRVQQERLRDQVALEPVGVKREAAAATLAGLVTRIDDIAARAGRGGDVGGLLGPLEIDAATFERDLIVGNAQRRDARDKVVATRELREDLLARQAALESLAAQTVRMVDPAPRYAVPDVGSLGEIPSAASRIDDYMTRLDRVSQALALAQQEYGRALDEHGELIGELDELEARARDRGLADDTDLAAAIATARDVLTREPTPMVVARQLVLAARTWLDWLGQEAR